MTKRLILIAFCAVLCSSCFHNYDDFEITGVVVDYEVCTTISDIGYAIQLITPDSTGGNYRANDSTVYPNTVVVYNSDRSLHQNDTIKGRIFIDPNHSDAECNMHYRSYTGNIPEAVFTELKVL